MEITQLAQIYSLFTVFSNPSVSYFIQHILATELVFSRHVYHLILMLNLTTSRYYNSTYKGGIET